jgi:nucleoside-diphosphate-sugar epimerase
MIEEASKLAGVKTRVNVVSPLTLKLVALFSPAIREMGEMMYEFTNPFIVDSSKSDRALGLSATPITEGLARTIAWSRKRAK